MNKKKPRFNPNSPLTQSVAALIKKHRLKAGLTRKGLAVAIGLHHDAIGKYERGVNTPSLLTLDTLCQELECTPNDLMGY